MRGCLPQARLKGFAVQSPIKGKVFPFSVNMPEPRESFADDGQLARRFYLAGGRGSAVSAASPALNALYAEKFSLDEQITALKRRKAQMAADAYDDELEKLLLALARKSREIRQLERGS